MKKRCWIFAALAATLPLTFIQSSFAQGGTPNLHFSRPIASVPAERQDPKSKTAHQQLLAKAKHGGIDVYFEGDSIIRRWGAVDYPQYLQNWKQNFFGWNAADFGWGGDTTNNIIWRLQHGELDDVNPKVVVILAGTNNVGPAGGSDADAQNIAGGIKTILDLCREKAPHAKIILTAIFPRNDNMEAVPLINKINKILSTYADGNQVRYLNINGKLADEQGKLLEGMMYSDNLHPRLKGYQVWADGLKPIFTKLLGPPAKADHAPPATGDPSAANRHKNRSRPGQLSRPASK